MPQSTHNSAIAGGEKSMRELRGMERAQNDKICELRATIREMEARIEPFRNELQMEIQVRGWIQIELVSRMRAELSAQEKPKTP